VIINDHESSIYELKKTESVPYLPESLKEAIRAFVLVVAIRGLRGESSSHNTMLVNISHLKLHQDQLEYLISEYMSEIYNAIGANASWGVDKAILDSKIALLQETFNKQYNIPETFEDIFPKLEEAAGKVKTWAINQGNKKSENKDLDYSKHKENGLSAIVIGGHKLSRGLTLEGLSISYFARNSKAYDTLMQMCRWFGYRPTYKDLCRVYLPQESQDWYTFISSSIKEIYRELDLMSRQGNRPSEFGLKVREHPGAMIITAKNKIGASESEVISQDLWGQVVRRFKFFESLDKNKKNIDYSKSFVTSLINSGKLDNDLTGKEGSPLIFSDVDFDDVIDFIKNTELPEDDLGNTALIKHLEKMKNQGLKKFKVCLYNQVNSARPKWIEKLNESDTDFIEESYEVAGEKLRLPKRAMNYKDGNYYIPSVHLGGPADEKYFLDKSTREEIYSNGKVTSKNAISFDYISSEKRDFPGLIIYLFAVAHVSSPFPFKDNAKVSSKVKLAHGQNPTLGFSISLPRIDKLKGFSAKELLKLNKETKHSYTINKIKVELGNYFDVEAYDDE